MNKITSKDLNQQDALNTSSSITAKEGLPTMTPVGEKQKALKGSFAGYGGSFKLYDEYLFIDAMRTQIYEFLTEQFKYLGLPKGLTKYRIERKLIENGIVYLVKEGDSYFACNGTVLDWNMYKEPVSFIVNEPKSSLNGRKYKQNDNWVFLRNNIKSSSKLPALYRYLSQLEKVLFQIEKNLVASAPKGLIDTRLGHIVWTEPYQPSMKNTMERIINSQDTFFAFDVPENEMSTGRGSGLTSGDNKVPFIPIELTDRTENLIKNFIFYKEQIKEMIGAELNSVLGKKERMITDEVNQQQELSNKTQAHALEIRTNDLEVFNETFNENVTLESCDKEEEEETLPEPPKKEGE